MAEAFNIKEFQIFVVTTDTIGMGKRGIDYATEVAIRSKHGGLTKRHRMGLEDRRLFNLESGLSQACYDSDLRIYSSLMPEAIVKPASEQPRQELFDRLSEARSAPPGITYIGELIPNRGAPSSAPQTDPKVR